jgi:hypothetical protein
MEPSKRLIAIFFAALAAALGSSGAETLVSWDTSGIPAADSTLENAEQPHPLLLAANANPASGLSSSDMDHLGLIYSTAVAPGGVGTSIAGELNIKNFDRGGDGINDNYLFFTLTADAGNTLTISSIVIELWRNGGGAPNGMAFDVSIDGGALEPYGSVVTVDSVGGGVYMPLTFTETITGASSVEIRFTPRNAGAGSTGNLHIDALRVEGDVVPASGVPAFAITNITLNQDTTISLTWTSDPAEDVTYSVYYNGDLAQPIASWGEANDSVPTGGTETTYLLRGLELPQPLPDDLFFIVLRNP